MSIHQVPIITGAKLAGMAAGRLAQLDQAVATVGRRTLVGLTLIEARTVWDEAARSLREHAAGTRPCGDDGARCVLDAMVRMVTEIPVGRVGVHLGATEVLSALIGVTTFDELGAFARDLLRRHDEGAGRG